MRASTHSSRSEVRCGPGNDLQAFLKIRLDLAVLREQLQHRLCVRVEAAPQLERGSCLFDQHAPTLAYRSGMLRLGPGGEWRRTASIGHVIAKRVFSDEPLRQLRHLPMQ